MEDFCRIVIVMEMLAVNLFTVDVCTIRRYSAWTTAAALAAFTAVLTFFTHGLWAWLDFDRGSALFSLIGVVYLLPLKFLYRERLGRITGVLFSCWIYTLLVFCVSVRIAYLAAAQSFIPSVLLLQSVLYLLSLYPFILWIRRGFLFVLRHITQNCRYLLQLVSLGWFATILILNTAFLHTGSEPVKLLAIAAVMVNAFLSYLLIYSMVTGHRKVKNLEDIVYVDALTGSLNRACLFKDARDLVGRQTPFRLIFMDLNRFKSVNDEYGHLTGDQYLVAFVTSTLPMLTAAEQLYRMSGDEFVILSRAPDYDSLMAKLRRYPEKLAGMDLPFLGCSMGWADYPGEEAVLDKLISLADRRMYEDKQTLRPS